MIKGSAGLVVIGASGCFGARDVVTDCRTVGIAVAVSRTIVWKVISGEVCLIDTMTTSLTWPMEFASHHTASAFSFSIDAVPPPLS
jgi:hypothetical protein